MRRFLLLALIVLVLGALTLPALAARPSCEEDPTRPWCDDTTTSTTTTTVATVGWLALGVGMVWFFVVAWWALRAPERPGNDDRAWGVFRHDRFR